MTDTNTTDAPSDADLIQAATGSLADLHAIIDAGTDPALKAVLTDHHAKLLACLTRYNEVYAPEGQTVMVARVGGGKPE